MMKVNEIQQRFTQIEQAINQAALACQSDKNISKELKDCVKKLDQQSDQMKQALQAQDEARIRQYTDELEQLGDRARDACQAESNVKPEIKTAVLQAHRELSDLKRQLH
jgi:hypothetical protein